MSEYDNGFDRAQAAYDAEEAPCSEGETADCAHCGAECFGTFESDPDASGGSFTGDKECRECGEAVCPTCGEDNCPETEGEKETE